MEDNQILRGFGPRNEHNRQNVTNEVTLVWRHFKDDIDYLPILICHVPLRSKYIGRYRKEYIMFESVHSVFTATKLEALTGKEI